MTTEPPIQDAETLKPKIEALDDALDGSHNYHSNFPHSDRHGLRGYHLYFVGDYVFPRTVEAIRDHGLEITSMSRYDGDFKPNATIQVQVREKNTEITALLDE